MATLDQKTVKLLGGASSFDALCPCDADEVVDIVEQRLMLSLCMCKKPAKASDVRLWKTLLSVAVVAFSNLDTSGIKSENIESYSYTLTDSSSAWDLLKRNAGDLLGYFSQCRQGSVSMQTDFTWLTYSDFGKGKNWIVGGVL